MKKKTPDPAEASFEEALAALEKIVDRMDSDTLPLEELIDSYEQGSRWLAICRSRLDQARQRIEKITRDAGGGPQLEPLDDTGPARNPNDELF